MLTALTPIDSETPGPDGRQFLRRILPYRTQEERIDGVVITYSDISEFKRAGEAPAPAFSGWPTNAAKYTNDGGLILASDLQRLPGRGHGAHVVAGDLQQHGQALGARHVIVDDQDALRRHGPRRLALGVGRLLVLGHQGQPDDEAAALVQPLAERLDAGAMEAGQVPHQGQADAHPALRAIEGMRPEVLLLDIGMPDVDGYELARQLRELPELGPQAQCIAITGFGRPEDFEKSSQAGFFRHLVKPVDPSALDGILEAARDSRELP